MSVFFMGSLLGIVQRRDTEIVPGAHMQVCAEENLPGFQEQQAVVCAPDVQSGSLGMAGVQSSSADLSPSAQTGSGTDLSAGLQSGRANFSAGVQ